MKTLKKILCLLAAVAIAMAVLGCGKKEQAQPTASGKDITVQLSIDGSAGNEKYDVNFSGKTSVPEGATAYDALKAVCDSNGFEIEGEPSYVTGIGGLGEGSFGSNCGWMYMVNGDYAFCSADEYALSAGDDVVWIFMK